LSQYRIGDGGSVRVTSKCLSAAKILASAGHKYPVRWGERAHLQQTSNKSPPRSSAAAEISGRAHEERTQTLIKMSPRCVAEMKAEFHIPRG
jgi:hypothetical protein